MACRAILGALTLAYLAALGGYAAGTFGRFDLATDRPSAVVLIVLGMPWVLAPLDMVVSQTYWPVVAVAAPVANLSIVRLVCRRKAS